MSVSEYTSSSGRSSLDYLRIDRELGVWQIQKDSARLSKFLETVLQNLSQRNAINEALEFLGYIAEETTRQFVISLTGKLADEMLTVLSRICFMVDTPGVPSESRIHAVGPLFRIIEKLASNLRVEVPSCLVHLVDAEDRDLNQDFSKGGCGCIYRYQHPTHGKVIIKTPRRSLADLNDPSKCETIREWIVACHVRHQNIIEFLGLVQVNGRWGAMSPEVAYGNALDFVNDHNDANRVALAKGITDGLIHLHERKIRHGDLKPDNILVDASGPLPIPKLCDFGFSSSFFRHPTSCLSASDWMEKGTALYMAPELLYQPDTQSRYRIGLHTDIWSLGSTLLELFTGQRPYSDEVHLSHIIMKVVQDGKSPMGDGKVTFHVSPYIDADVRRLCQACWMRDPSKRPTANALAPHLASLASKNKSFCVGNTNEIYGPVSAAYDLKLRKAFGGTSLSRLEKKFNVSITREEQQEVAGDLEQSASIAYQMKGNELKVKECLRIIKVFIAKQDGEATATLEIPKIFHARFKGHRGRNKGRIERKHGVKIRMERTSEAPDSFDGVTISGGKGGVKCAKQDIKRILKVLSPIPEPNAQLNKVEPRNISTTIQLQRQMRAISGQIVARIKGLDGISSASYRVADCSLLVVGTEKSLVEVHGILKDIKAEVTPVSILIGGEGYGPIQPILFQSEGDWRRLISSCRDYSKPTTIETKWHVIARDGFCRIDGDPNAVKRVEMRLKQLSQSYEICGMKLTAWRHSSINRWIRGESGLQLRATGVRVYFPDSPGYIHCGTPSNEEQCSSIATTDLVKLIGTPKACQDAVVMMKTRVKEMEKCTSKIRIDISHHSYLVQKHTKEILVEEFDAEIQFDKEPTCVSWIPHSAILASGSASDPYMTHRMQRNMSPCSKEECVVWYIYASTPEKRSLVNDRVRKLINEAALATHSVWLTLTNSKTATVPHELKLRDVAQKTTTAIAKQLLEGRAVIHIMGSSENAENARKLIFGFDVNPMS